MGGFGSNLVKSTAEQREWYEKASNVDNMLQSLCKEIKDTIEETKHYSEKLKDLEKEEKELSQKEEDWKKKKSQLVDLAVKAILEGGV
jgi:septation ring formation regulator EzrA